MALRMGITSYLSSSLPNFRALPASSLHRPRSSCFWHHRYLSHSRSKSVQFKFPTPGSRSTSKSFTHLSSLSKFRVFSNYVTEELGREESRDDAAGPWKALSSEGQERDSAGLQHSGRRSSNWRTRERDDVFSQEFPEEGPLRSRIDEGYDSGRASGSAQRAVAEGRKQRVEAGGHRGYDERTKFWDTGDAREAAELAGGSADSAFRGMGVEELQGTPNRQGTEGDRRGSREERRGTEGRSRNEERGESVRLLEEDPHPWAEAERGEGLGLRKQSEESQTRSSYSETRRIASWGSKEVKPSRFSPRSVGSRSVPSKPSNPGNLSKYSGAMNAKSRNLASAGGIPTSSSSSSSSRPAFSSFAPSNYPCAESPLFEDTKEQKSSKSEKSEFMGGTGDTKVGKSPENTDVRATPSQATPSLPQPDLEYQYSYTETPKVAPIGYREAPYSPFGPETMERPWTGKAPLPGCKKKLPEFNSPKPPPQGKKGVKSVQAPGPSPQGQSRKRGQTREEILGEPVSKAEVVQLLEDTNHGNRQLNLGRDGLTHNMLDVVHQHWKRRLVCKIKCKGVPTVDMDNVCNKLEEKTGGKIIHRAGGVVYLFRGRNYNYKTRPQIRLMLWKPTAPIYPKLIQPAPEGLTIQEADKMRAAGRQLLAICRLGKNGVYLTLVTDVRDAFKVDELVKVDCKGLNPHDFKKIGAKLKDLVPCVLLSFERECILMWRGRDWKSDGIQDNITHAAVKAALNEMAAKELDACEEGKEVKREGNVSAIFPRETTFNGLSEYEGSQGEEEPAEDGFLDEEPAHHLSELAANELDTCDEGQAAMHDRNVSSISCRETTLNVLSEIKTSQDEGEHPKDGFFGEDLANRVNIATNSDVARPSEVAADWNVSTATCTEVLTEAVLDTHSEDATEGGIRHSEGATESGMREESQSASTMDFNSNKVEGTESGAAVSLDRPQLGKDSEPQKARAIDSSIANRGDMSQIQSARNSAQIERQAWLEKQAKQDLPRQEQVGLLGIAELARLLAP